MDPVIKEFLEIEAKFWDRITQKELEKVEKANYLNNPFFKSPGSK